MSREVACRYEIGDDTLFEHFMPQILQANGTCKNVNQRFRRDEISKPKARIQNFAEASGIEHPLIAIEAFESRQGPADVAKFAVVIVLKDPGARVAGPRQKGKPPRQRYGAAQRTLMGGGHYSEAGTRRPLTRVLDTQ